MQKRKLLLALGIVTMLTLPTIQVHATDVDIDTEERNPDVEVKEENPDVEVADTESETNLGRSNLTWIDRQGILYRYNATNLTGTVVGYNGGSRDQLTVASTIRINGQNITINTIGDEAFSNAQIDSFELPDTLVIIGHRAFQNNRVLTDIVIPNNVISIGDQAFARCPLLTNVTLSRVTSIGFESFVECNIERINIPTTLTNIGVGAFKYNRLTDVTIPNHTTTIAANAFANNQLTNVTLPESIISIGNSAFSNNNLRSVRIPNSVTTIANSAFTNNNLTDVTSSDSDSSLTSIGDSAFANNNLTSISLPRKVTSIGARAFQNNVLTSVQIPESVTHIRHYAFETNQLTNAFIPDSVWSIGDGIFQHNPLTTIETDDGNADTLRGMLDTMGTLSVPTTSLIEPSPTRYDANVQTENNVLSGSNLELRTISQIKHVHNNNSGTWNAHVPVTQWYRNGTLLAGKNNATLSLSNLQESDSGIYHAVVDSTVLPNITVNVRTVYTLTELFPDINFAKAIAQELHGNENTNIEVSSLELASIKDLNLYGKGIQDLKGVEHIVNVTSLNLNKNKIQDVTPLTKLNNLEVLLLRENHINNIKPLSSLDIIYDARNQTIQLPEGIRREPTDFDLVDRDGSTPPITFVQGQGTYTNGKLTWTTTGLHQLTWQGSQFSGTLTQTVVDKQYPITNFFPDENLAKEIAQALYGNQDISVLTTETELSKINILDIPKKGITNLTGLDYLINLANINASGNHIYDIRLISKLPKITNYDFTDQTISLPEGIRRQPTDVSIVDKDGSTPPVTFIQGQGTYTDGKLTWSTSGENELTWQGAHFTGTITQTVVDKQHSISSLFQDENLAKAIAQELYSNNDISALTTETELATIGFLNIPNMSIKDLTGLDHLENLAMIYALGNHISDISILSKLPNIVMYNFASQTIQLPDGVRGEPTDLQLVGKDGSTPLITFEKGQGTYENGKLSWTTVGENQLTWQESDFSGTLTQTVVDKQYPISNFFPDENLAKEIAQALHGNQDISALTTETELFKINTLDIPKKDIKDLTGLDYLINLANINASGNHIHDIRLISKLSKITNYDFTDQTISLPKGTRGQPTDVLIVDKDGSTPPVTFILGQGTHTDGKLTWTTSGENELTWQGAHFTGTITQTVEDEQHPISSLFPDENLAKAIAQELNSNDDISALTTETELATIDFLNIPNMGIKDLTGLDYLNLTAINAPGNHISDIRIISNLPNIVMYNFASQTIQLPDGVRGEPTDLQLVGNDGSTPRITFEKGQGTYENGKLTWITGGENQLSWQERDFNGTLTQNVKGMGLPISNFFPDENLAKEIALLLNNNQDISAITTEEELSKISELFIPQKGIKDLTGIDHLKNLSIINASGNHISDIKILSKLPNVLYNFTNQTITLPEGVRGQPTDIPLVTINGTTPSISYVKGEGTYTDGKLTWSSVGENQLTWQSPQFTGTLTQTTIPPIPPEGQMIASLFPDENLAKEIAQELHSNQDTSVYVTEEQLLDIIRLSISNKGIKNLSGVENLKNLMGLDISHNHIHDISMLSDLPNLMLVMASEQTITLPEVTLGIPTKLTIRNEKGVTPNYTFTVGQGTYVDDELHWTTVGENQLTWSSSSLMGSFDGKVIQNVIQSKQTISSMFPDANFAQSIAMQLHGNTDTSVEVTEQDLARITQLTIPNRNIRSISGIENLQNLMYITAERNQITDISMLSKLPKLVTFYIAKQSVILSDVVTGTPTPLTLLNHNGIVPQYEFTVGNGSYNNGMLTWNTTGENILTWKQPSPSDGQFDGVIIQLTI